MKLNRCLSLLCVLPFVLAACNKPKNNSGGNMERPITYDEIYHNEEIKSEVISGANVYRASDGYTLNNEQGYNNFYYQYKVNNVYQDMSFVDNAFFGPNSKLDGKLMISSSNEFATRKFVFPVSGNVKITANPRQIDGFDGQLNVYLGNNLVNAITVKTGTGSYQEFVISVTAGQTMYFVNESEGAISYNPRIQYNAPSVETSLHYTADGYLGDVHPFYDYKTKKMYMFYLSTGLQEQSEPVKLYSSLLSTSSNMINYSPKTIGIDSISRPENTSTYVLGVYEDYNGIYRSCFGVSDRAGASMSTDLETWSNGADMYFDDQGNFKYHWRCYFGSLAGCGRDPDIYFDYSSTKFYCIVLTYKATTSKEGASGEKHLTVYKADVNGNFSENGKHIIDFTGRGDPECPQVKKIGKRWYVFYSIYGSGTAGNVGKLAYRIGDENVELMDVDWSNKTEYFLDGGDLHAAQLVNVGDKMYLYGWINYYAYQNIWGGYLNLPHEVIASDNGELYVKLDEKLTDLLSKGEMLFNEQVYNTSGTLLFEHAPRSIVTCDLTLNENGSYSGIALDQSSDHIKVITQRIGGKLLLKITNQALSNSAVSISINDTTKTHFKLKLVIDGNFIEASLDDEYMLTANTHLNIGDTTNISTYIDGGSVSNVRVNRLATYENIYD